MRSWSKNVIKKLDPTVLGQPNMPKALHGINPRTIMGASKWRRFSLEQRTNRPYCTSCGKEGCVLDLHESYTIQYSTRTITINDYVPLCKNCHSFIHSGLLQVLVAQKKTSVSTARLILSSGFDICQTHKVKVFKGTVDFARSLNVSTAGIRSWSPPMYDEGWGQWKLIFEEQEYLGLTKEQWMKKYGNNHSANF